MKVLVACEESQAVTIELRKLGHEAYSCDLIPCSGGHPEWHIQADALGLLKGHTFLFPQDKSAPHSYVDKWDMIISFPPCTYLTVTGNRWFNVERYGEKALGKLQSSSLWPLQAQIVKGLPLRILLVSCQRHTENLTRSFIPICSVIRKERQPVCG